MLQNISGTFVSLDIAIKLYSFLVFCLQQLDNGITDFMKFYIGELYQKLSGHFGFYLNWTDLTTALY
jgi:hypothetical protein